MGMIRRRKHSRMMYYFFIRDLLHINWAHAYNGLIMDRKGSTPSATLTCCVLHVLVAMHDR